MNTPRTDAVADYGHINGRRYEVLESDELVPAQFARELETELNTLKKSVHEIKQGVICSCHE